MILKPRLFRKPNLSNPISKGLVGLWLMNEGSGNTVQDLSGNGNHATFHANGPDWAAGQYGRALKFNGSDDNILLPATLLGAQNVTGMTFYAIVTPSAVALSAGIIGGASNEGYGYYESGGIWVNSGTIPRMTTYHATTGYKDASSSITLVANTTYHICGVHDPANGTNYIYVNGVLGGSVAGVTNTGTSFAAAFIGRNVKSTAQYWFPGSIEYCAIYSRPLLASEIQQLYREPFCMFDRDPIELWTGAMGGGVPPVGNAGIMTCNAGYWGA